MKPLHLLVATYSEADTDAAVNCAAALARSMACNVTLLFVANHDSQRGEAEKISQSACAILEAEGLTTKCKVHVGYPSEEIVRESASGRYDLLILGQQPTLGLRSRIFGPVMHHVVVQASQPVLIAKEAFDAPHRFLLCDSGGHQVPLLDRLVAALPQLLAVGQEVTVLHVMSQMPAAPGINGRDLRATAEELIAVHSREGELLEQDVEKLADLPVETQPLVRHGLVVDEIVDEARKGSYDLVIIGAHQHDAWPRILLDDLAGQIMREIDRSVLVIP